MSERSDAERLQHYIDRMGPDLGPFFDQLWNDCVLLHLKWREYVALFGTSEARLALFNDAAPGFAWLVEKVFWDDLLLHICRLTDDPKVGRRQRETVTIRKLPAMGVADRCPELKRLVQAAQRTSNFARDWRDRRIAHRDLQLALDSSATPLDDASRQRVQNAIDAIVAVLNAVEAEYCRKERTLYGYASVHGGADAMLSALRDGLDEQAKRWQRFSAGQPSPDDLHAKPPI